MGNDDGSARRVLKRVNVDDAEAADRILIS